MHQFLRRCKCKQTSLYVRNSEVPPTRSLPRQLQFVAWPTGRSPASPDSASVHTEETSTLRRERIWRRAPSTILYSLAQMGKSSLWKKKSERASWWKESLPTTDSRGEAVSCPMAWIISSSLLLSLGRPWGRLELLRNRVSSRNRVPSALSREPILAVQLSQSVGPCRRLFQATGFRFCLDCFFIFILKILSARQSVLKYRFILEAWKGFLPFTNFYFLIPSLSTPPGCSTWCVSTSFLRSRARALEADLGSHPSLSLTAWTWWAAFSVSHLWNRENNANVTIFVKNEICIGIIWYGIYQTAGPQ